MRATVCPMVAPDFRAWRPVRKLTPTRTLPIVQTRRRRNRSKNSRLWRFPACASSPHPPAPLARRFRQREWLDIGGRGRSRTYRGRLAPSNGFEVRASHRTRYSSALGLAEDLAATQHDASVSFAAGHRHLVEIFENLNCQIAPDTGVVLEGCGGEGALGRDLGELFGDFGEARQRLRQKEAVVGDSCDAAKPLGVPEETLDGLGLEGERRGELAHAGWA